MSLKLRLGIRPILSALSISTIITALLLSFGQNLLFESNAAQVVVISSNQTLAQDTSKDSAQVENGIIKTEVTVTESPIIKEVLGASTSNPSNRDHFSSLFSPKKITLDLAGYIINTVTYFESPRELLQDLQVLIDQSDIIVPTLDSPLSDGMKVTFIDVEEKIEESYKPIAFKTEIIDDAEVEWGEQVIKQPGVEGKVVNSIRKVYHNGMLAGTIDLGQSEVAPINEIVSKGTKIVPKTATMVDGTEFTYCRVLKMKVTAYDASCLGCNNITALGYELKKGIVAVDPKVIPLRSTVYVPGYGQGFAADVGGAVKGNIIDVGFATPEERLSSWGGTKFDNVYVACPN